MVSRRGDSPQPAGVRRRRITPARYLIGYANPTPGGPSLAKQLRALRGVGCHNIWIEEPDDPFLPERRKALADCRPSDTLVVATLGCLLTPRKRLLEDLHYLRKEKIHFVALEEALDTRTPGEGKLVLRGLLVAIRSARKAHSQLVRYGLARGRPGGRPTVLPADKLERAYQLLGTGHNMAEVAEELGVCRASLYNAGLRKKKKPPSRGGPGDVAGSDRLRTA